jgi:hypothetical protein
MSFSDSYRTVVQEAIDLYGAATVAEKTGINSRNLKKWVDGTQAPRADLLGRVIDLMDWKLVKAGVNTDARLEAQDFVIANGTIASKVDLSQYEAVPLVKDPNIIRDDNHIPDSSVQHYALIHKSTRTLDECSPNLVAVSVAETAVGTLLEEYAVVIVDLNDNQIEQGRIYLVRNPKGDTYLRRVCVNEEQTMITFYAVSHNVMPEMYSINDDFGGEISRAIVGRGVRIRSDLRKL